MTAAGKRILIVEDDSSLRSLMRRQLENNGYTVVEAEDGTNIVELLNSEHIDLVISDVVMGARGGIHVARDVRQARPEVPILFVTGALSTGSGPLLDVARELGVSQVVAKPYEVNVLLDAVVAAFESPGNRL
jgi:two-component system cell cycle response regulator CpdR